ncbi:hypothetical protein FKM82_022989 [Ascaphus truei]
MTSCRIGNGRSGVCGDKTSCQAGSSELPVLGPGEDFSSPSIRQKLRKMLKRIGRLKCPLEVTYVPRSGKQEAQREEVPDLGRVQRRSAKVATFYLHEIASEELVKEWPKRKVLQDLVPDDRKVHKPRTPCGFWL